MKLCILLLCMGSLTIPKQSLAQEVEESAEVSLEDYSDEFQEIFFEALKQKGIENYDRAINLLLKCKQIDANNTVVDHELAKAYLAGKQYVLAQEFGISSLNAEPENLWYLNTLVDIIQGQGNTVEAIEAMIPYKNSILKENLALIYYRQKNYQKALNILNGIKKSSFAEDLALKINDSIKRQGQLPKTTESQITAVSKTSPLEQYRSTMAELISKNDFIALEKVSAEALESFPTQPYFYYANGLALNKNAKHRKAAEVLEAALDFLLDDVELSNKIYRELANAYTTLGNSSRANMYLSKIKSGS